MGLFTIHISHILNFIYVTDGTQVLKISLGYTHCRICLILAIATQIDIQTVRRKNTPSSGVILPPSAGVTPSSGVTSNIFRSNFRFFPIQSFWDQTGLGNRFAKRFRSPAAFLNQDSAGLSET